MCSFAYVGIPFEKNIIVIMFDFIRCKALRP